MTTEESTPLELLVHVAAKPATVFRFFTDPGRFARWMGGAMGEASLEPRAGGALRVGFPAAGLVMVGEVLELVPGERFVFSWGQEGEGSPLPPGSSRVEIGLRPAAQGTRVELRHSGLPGAESRSQHRGGWRIYLAFLATGAADEELGAARPKAVAGWFAAWAETDAARREALLAACCADEVEFRDAHAALASREDLGGHVAASQAYSRGIRLEPAGELSSCRELVRFGWKAVGPDGVLATGANVGRLGMDGRFLSVHGFRDAAE